jgi:thiamine pyrophosphate-dependent acetolactate synthase large subunit-like protein
VISPQRLPEAAEAAFGRAHPGDPAVACFLIPKNVAAAA